MGQRKQRKQRFLNKNPLCCFCGGTRAATTEDHIPPRTLFDGRRWPTGFVFPACALCQSVTAKRELLFGLLMRLHRKSDPYAHIKQNHAEYLGVRNNFPGLIDGMVISQTVDYRVRPDGQLEQGPNDRGTYSFADPRIADAIFAVSTKLLLALYYRHSGRIAPSESRMRLDWCSKDEFDERCTTIRDMANIRMLPHHQKTSLGTQFYYDFGLTPISGTFAIHLHEGMSIYGVLITDGRYTEEISNHFGGQQLFAPFAWPSATNEPD